MHEAIVRGLANSDHSPQFVVRFMHHVLTLLPLRYCCALQLQWAGMAYATWVLPKDMAPGRGTQVIGAMITSPCVPHGVGYTAWTRVCLCVCVCVCVSVCVCVIARLCVV